MNHVRVCFSPLRSPRSLAHLLLVAGIPLVALVGCEPAPRETYEVLEPQGTTRFPLEPHIVTLRARPTPEMLTSRSPRPLLFTLLDKRTLAVHRFNMGVGESIHGPWGGVMTVQAFVPDLQVRDGVALHGPEGHVNPAVWVVVRDGQKEMLHEGWFFSRDQALTAWDHARFDLSFHGMEPEALPVAPVAPSGDLPDGADGEIPNFPAGPLVPESDAPAVEEEKTG